MRPIVTSFFLFVFLGLANSQGSTPVCTGGRTFTVCAKYIRPYSDNAYFWSNICEFQASSSALIADQIERYDEGFPCELPYVATCCVGFGCANGIDCNGPETSLPEFPRGASLQAELPNNWVIAVECAIDNPGRVLANTVVTYEQSTTPNSCIESCIAQGYQYAGVEYGDECYCGTGYAGGVVPQAANVSDCSMPCAGSYYNSCGGSWRMQIFKAPTAL
ncbi:hypothetical protein BDY19DRAFT_989743 [Irpex rosettiformis]|uniref:Uncharacterized protein n=1 Tax=Irpex rosettiformis TaxID=378272 RepID=A0ACB8UFL1_9APHY|nr:hypothetical protein BDY19DRAFT_989743 [Irpex rosettiformis]